MFVPQTLEDLREGFPPEIEHVSASQVTQILRCPEQYRQVRLLGKRARPGGALIWGRADSTAVAAHYEQVIEDGVGLTVEDVQDAFADAFVAELDNNDDIDWGELRPERVKDQGALLAGLYRRDVAPYVEPIGVEVRFEYENPLLPVPIVGYCDVETPHAIIERKTAGRKESSPKSEWKVQGRIYQLTKEKDVRWHQSIRHPVNPGSLRVFGDDDKLTEWNNPGRAQVTLRLVAQAISTIKHCYTTYGPDNPWPNGLVHTWACNYCGFRPTCYWHGGE